MIGKALIVGANGRFGRAAANGLRAAGFETVLFARTASQAHGNDARWVLRDASKATAVAKAAEGCDVIVNALTPPYSRWAEEIPRFTRSMIEAAKRTGSHILVPGNIYNFGPAMPSVLKETTPQRATGTLGRVRIEMEQQYARAADEGVRTLILRAGDFYERKTTGNWFDSQITNRIDRGIVTYPGAMESLHCWAYLPDLGRAAAQCCTALDRFAAFDVINFPGHALTGAEFVAKLEQAAGRALKVKRVPWAMVRLLSLLKPDLRGVMEVSYQWRTPHALDGSRFHAIFPEFMETPVLEAFREAIADRIPTDHAASSAIATGGLSHAS